MHSRRIAVEKLRMCIHELAGLGYKRVAFIAHSLGGNIALKDCEDPAAAGSVSAIVCLATPFISAWRPRLLVTRGFHVPTGVVGFVAFAGIFMLLTTLGGAHTTSSEDFQSTWALVGATGAPARSHSLYPAACGCVTLRRCTRASSVRCATRQRSSRCAIER